MIKTNKFWHAALDALAGDGPGEAFVDTKSDAPDMAAGTVRLPIEGELPSLDGATTWLNSPPLTPEALRGKVVLVEFWTYTCINWLRTLPYVRSWAQKYKDRGLVVIGVHSPEFSFEHDLDNVRRAAKDMKVEYPIAVDSDFLVWRAFNNHYWPALYFVDAQGKIRHHRFGEEEYDRSERVIQQLLDDAGFVGVRGELVEVDARGAEAAADWGDLESPESYVGYERADGFASPTGLVPNVRRIYTASERLSLNEWALDGEWTVGREAASLHSANGRIAYRFHARDLNLVMGPAQGAAPVRFRVRLDGQAPGSAHGVDADEEGNGTAGEQRMYQLIRQTPPIADRLFEIEFLDSGAEAYVFTFG
jgi:thiol-disulfide isomerase/thioredoxin